MTTQYTPTLKLALPVTGELSGTWGDVVNDNITSMIEQAIAGLVTINTWTGNAHTLTTANGTTSESRCAMLVAATGGGAPTAAAEIICPAAAKLYVLQNNTSYAVTLKTSAGTGVAVAAGNTAFLFCDATNVNSCVTTIVDGNITGNLTVGGNATINGNTTLGNATSDTITATARFNTDLLPSTDNARDLGSAANAWKDLFIDGTATMALVAISGGTINGVSIGATTAATLINVDNLRLDGNTISSTDTNGNIVIAPNGTGDVQLDADTVRVGDAAAAVTLTSNGAGALTVTTGGAADLTLSTNSGTTSGTVVIANGVNGNITLTPDGTGDVILSADRVQIGDSNTDTTLTTNGTGSLNLSTNNGSNSGTIQIAQGVNGNITLTPNGTGFVALSKLSVSDTSTLVKTLTLGNTSFSGTAVFAPATPAKLYIGTGTVTDTTSAASATNATGAVSSLAITPIAATNASVTYTNASTLYIAGAPSAGTNVTITNPYSLYVAAGDAYFGGTVTAGTVNLTTLDLTNLEVTNIKAKDGTAAMTIADSTGAVTVSSAFSTQGNTTLGNAAADNVTVTGTVTSNLIFTDNTYNIGANGATRPANGWFSRTLTVGQGTAQNWQILAVDYGNGSGAGISDGIYIDSIKGGTFQGIGFDTRYENAGSWAASQAVATIVDGYQGNFRVFTNSGLTAGSAYSPSLRFSIGTTGLAEFRAGVTDPSIVNNITVATQSGSTAYGGIIGQRLISGDQRQGLFVKGTGSLTLLAQYNIDFLAGQSSVPLAADTGLALRITATGKVAIGNATASAEGLLTVGSGTATDKNGIVMNRGAVGSLTTIQVGLFNETNGIATGETLTMRSPNGYKWQNYNGGTEWARIDGSTGYLLLGTASNEARLTVSGGAFFGQLSPKTRYVTIGTTGFTTMRYDDNGYGVLTLQNLGITGSGQGFRISAQFSDDGIATYNAGYMMFVTENTFTGTASTQDSAITFATTNNGTTTETVRFTGAGRVGFNTNAPSSLLEVVGASAIDSTGGFGAWTLRLRDTTATAVAGTGSSILMQGIKATGGGVGNYAAIAGLKENSTNNNEDGYLGFFTVPNSTGLITQRGRFASNGTFVISSGSNETDYGILQVFQASGGTASSLGFIGSDNATISSKYSMVFQIDSATGQTGRAYTWKHNGKGYSDGDQLMVLDADTNQLRVGTNQTINDVYAGTTYPGVVSSNGLAAIGLGNAGSTSRISKIFSTVPGNTYTVRVYPSNTVYAITDIRGGGYNSSGSGNANCFFSYGGHVGGYQLNTVFNTYTGNITVSAPTVAGSYIQFTVTITGGQAGQYIVMVDDAGVSNDKMAYIVVV